MRLLLMIMFLVGCSEQAVKPGFEFSVDENAWLTSGPVSHCRQSEFPDTYYCQLTPRTDFESVISSGYYKKLDVSVFNDLHLYIQRNHDFLIVSPIDPYKYMDNDQILILIISDQFSDGNFESSVVFINPTLVQLFERGDLPLEEDLSFELGEYLVTECEMGEEGVFSRGNIYFVVPERCMQSARFIEQLFEQ